MGKKKTPKPPDPAETAAAQTGQNISTAVAQQLMNMQNQYSPYGSISYNQTGTYKHVDPISGKVYDLPRFSAEMKLSPQEQALFDANQQQRSLVSAQTMGALQANSLGAPDPATLDYGDRFSPQYTDAPPTGGPTQYSSPQPTQFSPYSQMQSPPQQLPSPPQQMQGQPRKGGVRSGKRPGVMGQGIRVAEQKNPGVLNAFVHALMGSR